MDLTPLGGHALALVLYPGAAALIGFGLAAESLLLRLTAVPAVLLRARALVPGALTAVLLAVVAATQLTIPFNPVPDTERSAIVAAVALFGAVWAATVPGRNGGFMPRQALLAQGCFLIALLAPAIAAGTVRPAALGLLAVPSQLPVKAAAGLLYLLSLPGVLGLLPGTRLTPGGALARVSLWLPACGLGASLYLPPAAADVVGLARFAAEAAAAAVVAVLLARFLQRAARPEPYWRLLPGLALVTVGLAVLANVLG